MGLKDFKIRFDNVHAIYQPGQTVSGHVIVNVDSVKKTRGIKIVILGSADTYWTADRQELNNEGHYENEQELVTAHEEYFKTEYYLLGSASGNEIELTTGTHEYPFTCSLPTNLPSSFESDYGRIRYTIKATLDRPWKFDHETKKAFTVISTLDLNELPSVSEPIHMEKSKNFCCLCCGSPPLTINAKLPVRGYVPGQSIPVNLNIENQSGVTIKNVKVMLKKIVTYHATNPRTDKKICEDIVSEVSKGPVNGNEISSYEQKLDVPSIPPSNLDHCKIIDLEYKIEILACAQGWYHRNLSESTTIYIGTLPLSSYQTPQPHSPKSDQVDTGDSTKANEATGMYPTIPAPSAPEEPPSYTPAASNLYPNLAPPSYEESIFRSRGLRDRGESTHVIGIDQRFAPRYPVYNFSSFQ